MIGLACATELADRGHRVLLAGRRLPGDASTAAAGLLAPSLESRDRRMVGIGRAARDLFPRWVESLRERTGRVVALNREGIIDVRPGETRPHDAKPLDAAAILRLEPELTDWDDASLHPHDGCVDNPALVAALEQLAQTHDRIEMATTTVKRIERAREQWRLTDEEGTTREAAIIVIAAGAWSAAVGGLPRPVPVEPVRGQMIAFRGAPLHHAVYGPSCYLVPRGGELLAGSTMERVGFDASTTAEGTESLRAAATTLLPSLAQLEIARSWAGVRPVTPDLLPLLGADPEEPTLIYSTGHSRNGILLARISALMVACIVGGQTSPWDTTPFDPARFERA